MFTVNSNNQIIQVEIIGGTDRVKKVLWIEEGKTFYSFRVVSELFETKERALQYFGLD